MGRVVAAVLAAVWAMCGWRNMPQLDHGQGVAAGFVIATSIGVAYIAGRRRQAASNLAVAVATAEASAVASVTSQTSSTAAVNVFVASPESVAYARSARAHTLDDAPWMVGASRHAAVEEEGLQAALMDVESEREYEER